MLATINPFPILIVFCLLVALYMFAAIKFPALRFLFRLRGGVAGALGVEDETNRRVGENLGLVLCPLFGVVALLAAAWMGFQWRQSNINQEQRDATAQQEHQRRLDQLGNALKGWEVVEVEDGAFGKFGTTDEGLNEIKEFVRGLGEQFTPAMVPIENTYEYFERDEQGWRVLLKPRDESPGQAVIRFNPGRGSVILGVIGTSERPPTGGVALVVPEGLQGAMEALRNLERVDLRALAQEEARERAERDRKLSRYLEKTHEGTPAYQIFEAVMAAPEEDRDAKKAEFIGMSVDWEVQLRSVVENNGVLQVKADQSRPDPGSSWLIYFEVSPETLPGMDRAPRVTFARIKGEVVSLNKGIQLTVESLELFQPE